VWVGDVIDVNLYFYEKREKSGVFNVGTGRSQSFNDMAVAVVNESSGRKADLQTLVEEKVITYIPFPEALLGKYQSFTEADLTALRGAGYQGTFATVEEGVARYALEQG